MTIVCHFTSYSDCARASAVSSEFNSITTSFSSACVLTVVSRFPGYRMSASSLACRCCDRFMLLKWEFLFLKIPELLQQLTMHIACASHMQYQPKKQDVFEMSPYSFDFKFTTCAVLFYPYSFTFFEKKQKNYLEFAMTKRASTAAKEEEKCRAVFPPNIGTTLHVSKPKEVSTSAFNYRPSSNFVVLVSFKNEFFIKSIRFVQNFFKSTSLLYMHCNLWFIVCHDKMGKGKF